MKKYLFIIDPQNDFIEGGSLPVPGGKKALENIATSGILDDDFEKIIVTLDSHNSTHRSFGESKTKLRRYFDSKLSIPNPTPWPPHCIYDTYGWEIAEPLFSEIIKREEKVIFFTKGEDDYADSYSFLDSAFGDRLIQDNEEEVDDLLNEIFYNIDINQEEVVMYWTGLAEDYCVIESIRSIMRRDLKDKIKHVILSDMTAAINPKTEINEKNLSITPYRS